MDITTLEPGTPVLSTLKRDTVYVSLPGDVLSTAAMIDKRSMESWGCKSKGELLQQTAIYASSVRVSLTVRDKKGRIMGIVAARDLLPGNRSIAQAYIMATEAGAARFKDFYRIYQTVFKIIEPSYPIWCAVKNKLHKTESKLLNRLGFKDLPTELGFGFEDWKLLMKF